MAGKGKALTLLFAAALLASMTGCAAQVVDDPEVEELDAEESADLLVDGTQVAVAVVAQEAPGEEEEPGEEIEDPEPTPWVPLREERFDPEPTPWKQSGPQGSPSSSEGGTHK